MNDPPSFGLLQSGAFGLRTGGATDQVGTYGELFERANTLAKCSRRGIEPTEAGDLIDLFLEDTRIDGLPDGNSNCATHCPDMHSQGGMHWGYEISAPEEAKSARRCGHIFDRHGRLQSNEGHLEGSQQPWPHAEECSTWNRQLIPSALTSG